MAHKTLVNSTAYEISGGKTLVEGTSYSVKNGKVLVGGTEYDISFLLPPAALNLWNGTESSVNCILYADGYWVVGGTCYEGGTYRARIAYATELDGTWTTKNIWNNAVKACINCITYANGYWVVGGCSNNRSAGYASVGYATSLNGTWTNINLWGNSSHYNTINCITYADGYWVVGGVSYSADCYYVYIAYTTSLDGTWTEKYLWLTYNSATSINCITYANGYWVVGGGYTDGGYIYAFICYSTSPGATWTTKKLWNDTSDNSTINCITYANGYWVVGGEGYPDGYHKARIAYATSLDGTWTIKDLWGNIFLGNYINCITYADGYWVVGGRYYDNTYHYARIAYSTSLSGTWTIVDLSDGLEHSINDITYGDGYIVAGGIYYYGGATYARIYYSPTLKGFGEITI